MCRHALRYLPLAALILLGSCATIRRGADRGMARALDRYLDRGEAARIARMTQLPFLLDGEVVVLPQDVRDFWVAVVDAGWRMDDMTLDNGSPVDEDTWMMFARTQEVRSFFRNYVGEKARLLVLSDDSGRRALLLVQERPFSWRILGLATFGRGGGAS